jgi:hypothetical protein
MVPDKKMVAVSLYSISDATESLIEELTTGGIITSGLFF